MSKKPLTPWQRIMRAAKQDKGLRLSADEVFRLSQDSAIAERAMNDDEELNDDEVTAEGYKPLDAPHYPEHWR